MTTEAKQEVGIKVAKVLSPVTLILNKGEKDGVRLGQKFLIFAFGSDITDPDSGKSLGKLEIVRGTGKITHLQDSICTLSSDMKTPPSRTIRKKGNMGSYSFPQIFPQTEEIIELPPNQVAFEDPEIGDIARPI